jgi:hypothetical protein
MQERRRGGLAVQIYIAERYSLTRCAQLTRRKGLAERGQVGVVGGRVGGSTVQQESVETIPLPREVSYRISLGETLVPGFACPQKPCHAAEHRPGQVGVSEIYASYLLMEHPDTLPLATALEEAFCPCDLTRHTYRHDARTGLHALEAGLGPHRSHFRPMGFKGSISEFHLPERTPDML